MVDILMYFIVFIMPFFIIAGIIKLIKGSEYKQTFEKQQHKESLSKDSALFKSNGIRSSLDIGDRFYIDSI